MALAAFAGICAGRVGPDKIGVGGFGRNRATGLKPPAKTGSDGRPQGTGRQSAWTAAGRRGWFRAWKATENGRQTVRLAPMRSEFDRLEIFSQMSNKVYHGVRFWGGLLASYREGTAVMVWR